MTHAQNASDQRDLDAGVGGHGHHVAVRGFGQCATDIVAMAGVVMLGVVNTAVMMSLVYTAISRLPTYLFAALSFVYPLVAVLLDWWVFNHVLNI